MWEWSLGMYKVAADEMDIAKEGSANTGTGDGWFSQASSNLHEFGNIGMRPKLFTLQSKLRQLSHTVSTSASSASGDIYFLILTASTRHLLLAFHKWFRFSYETYYLSCIPTLMPFLRRLTTRQTH